MERIMPEKLIPLSEVEAAIGFKKSHIYSLVKQGQFPAPVAIGTSRRWKQSDVQNWITEKIQQGAVTQKQT
jgi:prophage regulatory protein